jgi:hypothetical protein
VSEPLPELLDAKGLQAELGVTRAVAEKLMCQLPVVTFPGIRKVFVKRADVARLVEERTATGTRQCRTCGAASKDQVAA